MQRSALCILPLVATAVVASGCNDLGDCSDPARGRQTVKSNNTVMYAGQAIITNACASGCHASNAKGDARKGAPHDLNFDLMPVSATDAQLVDGGVTRVGVDEKALAGLRSRQRKVFDERENIWDQIDKGLMPPEGVGEVFRSFAESIKWFKYGAGTGAEPVCEEGAKLLSVGERKAALKQWLACGTPVVETVSAKLPYQAPSSDAGPAEQASGAYTYSGTVGYQLPECPMSSEATFQAVYDQILEGDTCTSCHRGAGALGEFDLGPTIDTAYTKLTTGKSTCSTTPSYVVPNDPAKSLLAIIVDPKATGRCSLELMPYGQTTGISAAHIALLKSWINAGAPRMGTGSGGGDGGTAGGDAGAGDAGVARDN